MPIPRRQLLELLLSVLFAYLAMVLIVVPLAGAFTGRLGSIGEHFESRSASGRLSLEELRKQNEVLRATQERLGKNLDLGEKRSKVLLLIQQSLAKAGLPTDQVKAQAEINALGRIELPYTINAKGTFHQMATLVNALETCGPVVSIRSLHLVSSNLVSNRLAATLELSFHSKTPKGTSAK